MKNIRMNKENYWVRSGWIAGGPSREAMFDSLRLGIAVNIQFIFTDKEIRPREAVITSITKKNPLKNGNCDEWVISLLFQEEYQSSKMIIPWSGFYSTHQREGEMTCELPKCLIK